MIFLLRHGEIILPKAKIFVGQSDLPLNATGVRQALFWRRWLEGRRLRRLHVSDLTRTRETASLILDGRVPAADPAARPEIREASDAAHPAAGATDEAGPRPSHGERPAPGGPRGQAVRPRLLLEPALREIHLGAWEGLTASAVRHRHPGQWEARGRDLAHFRPEGGESFADLAARVVPAFEAMTRQPDDILIVAHAGVNRVILCHVLGLPLSDLMRLHQDYGAMNLIEPSRSGYALHDLNLRPAV